MREDILSMTQNPRLLELDEIVRVGAHEMLKVALEAEVQGFLSRKGLEVLPGGKAVHVRNGHHRERDLAVGAGMIKVKVPRTRNRRGKKQETFVSQIVPPYMRRSLKIDEAIPLLYLKGLSTGDISPALEKLVGTGIKGLSPANVTRLKAHWKEEYEHWRQRDLSGKRYSYVWVDGIHVNVRIGENRLCVLVAIGALEDGTKELLAAECGYRESGESWGCLLRDLRARCLEAPLLFIGDGALGFWKAARDVYPSTKWQRCWVHKTANVLDKLPKSVQGKAKAMLKEIYQAETKQKANAAFDKFLSVFEAKYPRAADCLSKDRQHLLTFYDFPSQHWCHIRSTNVIESTFATVRLRTDKTRGQGNAETTLMMVFKLLEQASMRWRKLKGCELVLKVIEGIKFVDGKEWKKAA